MLAKFALILFSVPICLSLILVVITLICYFRDQNIPEDDSEDEDKLDG